MLGIGVGEVVVAGFENLLRRNFTVLSGDGYNLVSASLDCTGFVDVDVSRRNAKRRLMRSENRGNDDEVGLGTADEEMNVRIRCVTFIFYIWVRFVFTRASIIS